MSLVVSKSSQVVSRLKRRRDSSPDSADTSSSSSELEEADDAPVLSHAAKRKQKKAALLKDAVPEKSSTKKQKKEEDAPHSIKRQNSIWVGNLCYKTTPESLRRFFDGVGEITRVHLPTKLVNASSGESARRENRGFAYVDFATPEAKQVAVAMSESPLDGRRLLIKDGDSFEGRPAKPGTSSLETGLGALGRGQTKFAQKILSAQKQPPAPTLFFGNLGFETTVDSIRGLLEAHKEKRNANNNNNNTTTTTTSESAIDSGANNGEDDDDPWIRKIRMGTFEDSGQCKGFAFVDFTSIEHATAALINPKNYQLDGRKLVVEYASADAVRRGGGAGGHKRTKPKSASTEAAAAPKKSHARSKRRDSTMGDGGHGKRDTEATVTSSKSQEEKSTTTGRGNGASAKPLKVDHRRHKSRPAPGAALALARREQVAIVPSQGRRITFDDDS